MKDKAIKFVLDVGIFVLLFAIILSATCFIMANSPSKMRGFWRRLTGLPLGKYPYDIAQKYQDIQNHSGDSLDVAFFGSSHCADSFDPRYFRSQYLRTFNFGTDNQSSSNTYFITRWVAENMKVSTFVIEAYPPTTLYRSGSESYLQLLPCWEFLKPYSLQMAIASLEKRTLLHYLLTSFSFSRPDTRSEDADKFHYIEGGFLEARSDRSELRAPDNYRGPINKVQTDYFDRMLSYLNNHGKKNVVVIVPMSRDFEPIDGYYKEAVKIISDICDRNGVIFIDFHQILNLPNDDFYDFRHLNDKGVRDFLPVFLDKMIEFKVYPFAHDSGTAFQATDMK